SIPRAALWDSDPMFLDKAPVDLNTKTGQGVQIDHPIAHGRALGIQTMLDWMALRVPVRFHPKGTGTERRDEVSVNMGGRMGSNDHAVLFCQRGNTQRFGEASVPRGIELHEANGA